MMTRREAVDVNSVLLNVFALHHVLSLAGLETMPAYTRENLAPMLRMAESAHRTLGVGIHPSDITPCFASDDTFAKTMLRIREEVTIDDKRLG